MWNKIINLLKTTYARLMFRGEPSPKHWVFSSVHNQTFNYNSSYLFLYVKEHCKDIHPYYVINNDELSTVRLYIKDTLSHVFYLFGGAQILEQGLTVHRVRDAGD